MKLNGHLVTLEASGQEEEGAARSLRLATGPVRLQLRPLPSNAIARADAEALAPTSLLFEVGQELRVGYDGYAGCVPGSLGRTGRR